MPTVPLTAPLRAVSAGGVAISVQFAWNISEEEWLSAMWLTWNGIPAIDNTISMFFTRPSGDWSAFADLFTDDPNVLPPDLLAAFKLV